jgi:formylglycine-generating enzyme required for sulfatase activity
MIMAGLVVVGLCGMAQAGLLATDLVTIGYANNAADTADGDQATAGVQRYGAVAYTYKISKYAVSLAQMQASGAGSGNENYWNDGTRTLGTNAPAVYVTFYEAMKYCNWLTSGNTNNGAYNFSGGVYQSTDRASAITAYGKVYALPTEDEWYKAAYFKPDGLGYSLYANGSNTVPTKSTNGSTGWNYSSAATNWMATASPWAVDKGTMEQNGTFNMMGSVDEFVGTATNNLAYRGGRYNDAYMMSTRRDALSGAAATSNYFIGFRVVEVIPEPATIGMLGLGALITLLIRRIQCS